MQHFNFSATAYRSQRDRFGHVSCPSGIIKLVGDANPLVRNKLYELTFKAVTVTVLEIRKRHVITATLTRIDSVNFP